MKTSTKTLLASAVSAIALVCAGGAYAQAGGGAGGSAGGGGGAAGSAGGAGGTGGGTRGGAAPSGNSLEQPGVQPGMGNSNNTGGYGSPGSTRTHSGRYTKSPRMHHRNPSDTTGTTGGDSADQQGTYHGNGQQ